MANTVVWNKHDYVQKMRARINKPTAWADVLKVFYTDVYTRVNASLGATTTKPGTRGTAYKYDDFVLTADTLTISGMRHAALLVDEADRYQQNYINQMDIADTHGKVINEYIETAVLAAAIAGTNFGAGDLANTSTDDSTAITVSASNIDDIIRAVKRKINAHNGVEFAAERGVFFVWRPADFELLEAFCQANGFTEADIALKNGIPVQKAFRYMGVDHYLSTSHTTGHVFSGIKKTMEIGILRSTFGKVKFIEDPGQISGLGIVARLDYGTNLPASQLEFIIDLNVA